MGLAKACLYFFAPASIRATLAVNSWGPNRIVKARSPDLLFPAVSNETESRFEAFLLLAKVSGSSMPMLAASSVR